MDKFGQIEFKPITELANELLTTRMENIRLKDNFARTTAINDSLIEDNERLQKKLEQTESLWQSTTKTLQDEIDQLRAQLNVADTNLENVGKGWDFWMDEAQKLQTENDQLRTELAEERDRHDKLQDFEVAEAKDFQEAKLYLRILLEYLQETGYDVEKLEKIIALKRVLMKLEETNE